MSYRMDNRSVSQFKSDIKKCSDIEKNLMDVYVAWLNKNKAPSKYTYKHNGIDNSGKFIKDNSKVSSKADFVLVKDDTINKPIEIKHSQKLINEFHIKLNHVKKCIENDVCIINFMAINDKNIQFCIMTPKVLEEEFKNSRPVTFWAKQCLRFKYKDFVWHKINSIEK